MDSRVAKGNGPGRGVGRPPAAMVFFLAALLACCGAAAGASWPGASLNELVGAAPPGENAALANDGVLALGGWFNIDAGTGKVEEAGRTDGIRMRNSVLFSTAETTDAVRRRSCVVPPETPGAAPSVRNGPVGLVGRNLVFVMDGGAFRRAGVEGGSATDVWIDCRTGAGTLRLLNPLAVRLSNAASDGLSE